MAGHRKHPCNQVHAIILRTISVNSKQPCGFDKLLRFFNPGDCRRALADDQDDRVLILGAVPMDLLAKMGDEGARRHRYRVGRIELCRCQPTTCP
jgi:hypothetical protein